MIKATICRHGDSYRGYRLEGHAEYADSGNDIICAAVSVLAENTLNSIMTLTHTEVAYETYDGYLDCSFPEGLDGDGHLLMESMLLGLTQIAEITRDGDGGNFLTLEFTEV